MNEFIKYFVLGLLFTVLFIVIFGEIIGYYVSKGWHQARTKYEIQTVGFDESFWKKLKEVLN